MRRRARKYLVFLTYFLFAKFYSTRSFASRFLRSEYYLKNSILVDEAKKIRGFYEGESSEEEDDGEGEWSTPDNVDEDDSDENDDSDWITPFNIDDVPEEVEEAEFVACLTTDFAMQNVLLKMKIGMIGVEGRKIKNARKYILRCTGCKFIDKTSTKVKKYYFYKNFDKFWSKMVENH